MTVLLGVNDSIARPDFQALRHQLNEVQYAENRGKDNDNLEDDGGDGASIS